MEEKLEFKEVDLLRFSTAGSVDDGKSTLIGRLLYDSKSVYEDVIDSVASTSERSGKDSIDLALLTDGLKAEREQGITIDVAYRYFSTPTRRFIIADTPGHEQYTRNMVTGASTASLAIILIDARKGILVQSKRHAIVSSLLGIKHAIIAINKMDLVDWSQEVFENIKEEFTKFNEKLNFSDIKYVPISALLGDNVVNESVNMPWYNGDSIIHYLETVAIEHYNFDNFRFPVQSVLRPNLDYRGFSGQIASGVIKKGDTITTLPSLKQSKISKIDSFDGELEEAFCPQSVTILLEDEIDISRGDMIIKNDDTPNVSNTFDALVCWMSEESLELNEQYYIKHNSHVCQVKITNIIYNVDINTLDKTKQDSLNLNELAKVSLMTSENLYFDNYKDNKATGSFIIIDMFSNNTVGTGMINNKED